MVDSGPHQHRRDRGEEQRRRRPRSARERKDDVIMWWALGLYLAAWTAVPALLLGGKFWPVGLALGLVYVGGHVYEIVTKGHCYLSADATALPLAAVALLVTIGVLYALDAQPSYAPGGYRWPGYLIAFGASLMVGHIVALVFSALLDKLLPEGMFAPRAAASANGGRCRDQSPPHRPGDARDLPG